MIKNMLEKILSGSTAIDALCEGGKIVASGLSVDDARVKQKELARSGKVKYAYMPRQKDGTYNVVAVESAPEGFTPAMLQKMKDEYSAIKTIDPASPAYKKVKASLDTMSDLQLKQIVQAKIPFLRSYANLVLTKRGVKEEVQEAVADHSKIVAKVKRLVAANNHSEARLAVAQYADDLVLVKMYKNLIRDHEREGSLTPELSARRVTLDKQLASSVQKAFGKAGKDLIWGGM